jgi:hypothetical protein
MLPEDLKRRTVSEARRQKVSFADFVRRAISEKLPGQGRGAEVLKRRRRDPLFRLLDRLPRVAGASATDVAATHDDYLYGAKSERAGR